MNAEERALARARGRAKALTDQGKYSHPVSSHSTDDLEPTEDEIASGQSRMLPRIEPDATQPPTGKTDESDGGRMQFIRWGTTCAIVILLVVATNVFETLVSIVAIILVGAWRLVLG